MVIWLKKFFANKDWNIWELWDDDTWQRFLKGKGRWEGREAPGPSPLTLSYVPLHLFPCNKPVSHRHQWLHPCNHVPVVSIPLKVPFCNFQLFGRLEMTLLLAQDSDTTVLILISGFLTEEKSRHRKQSPKTSAPRDHITHCHLHFFRKISSWPLSSSTQWGCRDFLQEEAADT
jgi:hypothetical protein